MSPDDVFASQMWPWPEPALKRDSMGRVLFVNAAFLQMYGGQIEDWRGNIVTGWAAPQAPGMPYRFETRLPSEDGEQVYDWMEFTMADGNAFAMARNVTYLFQAPDPDPGIAEPVPEAPQAPQAPQVQPVAAQAAAAVATVAAATGVATAAASAEQAPEPEAAPQEIAVHEPIFEHVSAETPIVEAQDVAAGISAEVAANPDFDSASYSELAQNAPVADATAPAAPVSPVVEPVLAQPEANTERAYERRALPIENEEAVLGNNWRDAVIAKAVGAETPQEEEASIPEVDSLATSATEGETGPIRILLAEDNAINALLTRTLLEAEGHTVETVEDGVLACEAMKSSKYDLIFMDMRMPNMDGLEATRKIRAMPNVSKSLPIIALTANAFDDDRNACFDSGMNDFMTKPVSAEELSEMVRTWTKNKAERDAAAA